MQTAALGSRERGSGTLDSRLGVQAEKHIRGCKYEERVVAGQTFYLFTIDNLRQFGTLKAIGVADRTLVGMILLQALNAGAIGFAIGTGMEVTFVEIFLHKIATRGLILLWQSVAIAAACIVFVVLFASWLSIRRVLRLEAATVFRS